MEMLKEVILWRLKPAWVTGDNWYSSIGNMKKISKLNLNFMFGVEHNRIISIECGQYIQIQKLEDWQGDEKTVYFLSTEPIDKITAFATAYGLGDIENVTFGSISPATATAFGISGFPTTLIYSEEGKLWKKFKGEVKIEAVVNPTP